MVRQLCYGKIGFIVLVPERTWARRIRENVVADLSDVNGPVPITGLVPAFSSVALSKTAALALVCALVNSLVPALITNLTYALIASLFSSLNTASTSSVININRSGSLGWRKKSRSLFDSFCRAGNRWTGNWSYFRSGSKSSCGRSCCCRRRCNWRAFDRSDRWSRGWEEDWRSRPRGCSGCDDESSAWLVGEGGGIG